MIIKRKINVDNTSIMKIEVKIEFDMNKKIVQILDQKTHNFYIFLDTFYQMCLTISNLKPKIRWWKKDPSKNKVICGQERGEARRTPSQFALSATAPGEDMSSRIHPGAEPTGRRPAPSGFAALHSGRRRIPHRGRAAFKATDRLVSAMDLADDIRSQIEIANNKQQLWDQGLSPEGKENTPEVTRYLHEREILIMNNLFQGTRIREENDSCIREARSS